MKPTVIIYRDQLIPYSETFIPAQVEKFSSYQGFYVGTSRFPTAKSMLPQDRIIILGDLASPPELWKTVYKLTGFIHPRWLKPLQDLSPRLIHAHFGLDGVLVLPLAKKLNVPLIVTFHGYYATTELALNQSKGLYSQTWDFIKNRGQFYRELYFKNRDRLFQQAHCFIAVSEFIRSQLIKKGCPPEKIKVNYIGIDVDKFTPNPEVKREAIVLFVGRLIEKKGCEYLIRAIAQVQKTIPNVELVIIGDGILRSSLENLAANSIRNYHFLGVQPPEVVKSWMNKSMLLCTPSITTSQGETEGLPIVILEAVAMGLPVISSFHAGIPEAIIHEETGFLTEEKDSKEIAKYILILFQRVDLREKMVQEGRKRMENYFHIKQTTIKLEEIYSNILSSNLTIKEIGF
ncbi:MULTISPECIES: glycosyltransferase [unclassified Coleofasciculus]|uniref:glycosyltransferase n=1 Tax=unclassified Coleofasciculus TaxID=2692782 RepID=UPI0018808994|nr:MULTISPECIES: glycosyltransferase [unclassified Coleofasciculus]MBE9126813.1 glycosyltransferase [Coleofasciculus sp. LEGE 07081]MBE9150184.1 glycosyltransferase [Coleofasciculus sp. LEGE 07092]